jgi:adenylylsulfate kinase/bifunctional enzyme CysN/CysC
MLHIHPTKFKISQDDRILNFKQKPKLIWFTGLSGSGKSTLANGTESLLYDMGYKTYLLDGDNIRTGLSKDLSFSNEDRIENIRRIGEVSNLFLDAGLIVLSAFISPFVSDRLMISSLVGDENFLEIYVECPIEVCEQRDVKGLYKKARNGLITNFTGIDSPYEKSEKPFLTINTSENNLESSLAIILKNLIGKVKF